MDEQAKAAAVIAPLVAAAGLGLVRVALGNGPDGMTLQVMAEDPATRQLTLDQCAALSRTLSDALDTADPIAGEYRLEVSSPGIDRPLTRLADFIEWAGHDVRAEVLTPINGQKRFTGVLTGLDDGHVTIDLKEGGAARLPFADLRSAKLLLTDRLIAATRPLKADDADEIDADDDSDTDDAPEKE